MIQLCERRNRLANLIEAIQAERPQSEISASSHSTSGQVSSTPSKATRDESNPLGWRVLLGGVIVAIIGGLTLNVFWKGLDLKLFPSSTSTPSVAVTQQAVLTATIPKETATVVATAEPSSTPVQPTATMDLVSPTSTEVPSTATKQPTGTSPRPTEIPTQEATIAVVNMPCLANVRSSNGGQVQVRRDGPQASGSGLVNSGISVVVTGKQEVNTIVWYAITDPDGKEIGWIQAGYIANLSETCDRH